MRRLTKRLFLVMSLAALSAGLVSTATASATTAAACEFTGLAGNINPGVIAVANGTGGTGTYHFEGDANCVGTNSAGTPTASPAHIISNGSFTNTICGTGTATGDPAVSPGTAGTTVGTFVNFSDPSVADVNQANYNIDFRGGQGLLTITKFSSIATLFGQGHVTIIPDGLNGHGNCVNENVTAFTVSGAFAVVQ